MAMRLYDKEAFEADLRKRWKLVKTDIRSRSAVFWKTPNGKVVSVPELDEYPDYWLDRVHKQISEIESRDVPWS